MGQLYVKTVIIICIGGVKIARGRMIDKVIILSEKINAISEGAENLYYRIYVNTDDFGLYHANPKILKGQVYTLRGISIKTIEKRLNELIKIKLIKIYEINNEKYLEIVDFGNHQTFRKDYNRKYEYPKPTKYLHDFVRSRTESPTKLNKNNINKEKGIIKEIFECLIEVENYPLEFQKDKSHIEKLIEEFPEVDALEVIKKLCANWLDYPLNKKSRPRVQIRRWFVNQKKWIEEADKGRQVGKNIKPDDSLFPMDFLHKVYKLGEEEEIIDDKFREAILNLTKEQIEKFKKGTPEEFFKYLKKKMKEKK